MVIKKVNLETVVGITSKIPQNNHPEVAFAGKSNVGKSSLINGLINRRSYARVSQHPGKTQTINYYNINDELYVVDLPGYGFANVPETVKAKWGKMIEKYLHTSRELRMVFLLVDIRHEPSANDIQMYQWMVESGFYPAIIATKADKLKRSQLDKHVNMLRQGLRLPPETPLIPWSATTKQGRDEIWQLIEEFVLEAWEIIEDESITE